MFQTSLAWAVLAGAGASLLGMKLAAAILFTLYSETAVLPEYWRGPLPTQWTQFTGAALGVVVAMLAGGRGSVLLTLVFNVILLAPFIARQVLAPDCAAGTLCLSSDPAVALFANWPFAVGALLGAGAADLVGRRGPSGRNPLLEAAGVYAASSWSLLTLMAFVIGGSSELAYTQLGVAGLVATCATAMTCLFRSERPVRDVVLIAVSLFVANVPGVLEQIKQWLYFGVIDSRVMNPALIGMGSAVLLAALTAFAAHLIIEPRLPRLAWNLEKGG